MTLLDTLRNLDETIRDDLWANWPDDIPQHPDQWTDAHEARIQAAIDLRVGFNADADPRILEQARQRVAAAIQAAGLTDRDAIAAVIAYCDADTETVAGLEHLARTLHRVADRELVVHIGPYPDEAWTVSEAGEGSEVEHRRAVTDATTETGEWVAVVTIQHPTGAMWPAQIIRGTLAHHIANKILEQGAATP